MNITLKSKQKNKALVKLLSIIMVIVLVMSLGISTSFACQYFSITTSVTNGTITSSIPSIYEGSNTTITYSPNTGYHLVSVTVDGTAQSITTYPTSYTFSNIWANHTICVVYAINKYTINTTVTNGTITPTESGISYGSNRTITYSANTGYHLSSVTVDGTAQSITTYATSYSFNCINANHTVAVVYAINTYTIDTTVTNGTITPDESGIAYGSNRTITYTANTGYHLSSVTVDGIAQSITTYATSYSFTGITANHTVVVVYAINTYTIDTTVTNGTITPDETGIAYGSNRTITYTANTGYHLVSVTVDGTAQNIATYPGSYSFNCINADHTVVVVYAINTYTIDTTVTNGTITPDESGITYGSNRTITYTANTGYHLASVTVDGIAQNITTYATSYSFTGIAADHTVVVVYSINTYTIDTTVTNGTITPDETGIAYGSNRTITYSPNTGYHLVSVTVDGTAKSITTYPTSYSFTGIAADHTVVVVYAINTYTIDTTVTNGTITPDESGIAYGSNRTITYSPNTGYHLVSVTVDGTAQNITTYPGSYSFTGIAADHTVAVVYAINTYTIDTTVTNGTITPDESGITYGSDRTIIYSPNTGYHLVSVTVDGTAQNITTYPTSYSFTSISANHTVLVVYAINTYTIDTTVTNGTITPDESGIGYGSNRTITYSPNTGYHLVSVTVDGTSKNIGTYSDSYSFTGITADHTVVVVYAINTYTIDTTVTNGTITPDETGIGYGSNRTITYSPNTGYHLVSVTVDGTAQNITTYAASYSFTGISADHTVVVVYEIDTYKIDTVATHGTITDNIAGIALGDTRTITYSPDTGYHLVSVTVDGIPVNIATYPSSYSFINIGADHTIAVVFEIDTYKIDTAATHGTITDNIAGIALGDTRIITYTPDTGYHLVSVTVDGTPVNITTYPNSYSFINIGANHTIAVVFAADTTYKIDTAATHGTITDNIAGIEPGDTRTITYTPDAGYHLVSVTIDGTPVNIATYPNSYSFINIGANHTIVVVFASDTTYKIDTAATHGTITDNIAGIEPGDTRIITYTPETGYHLVSVTIDGTSVNIATYPNSYSFTNIGADHTIVVVFAINTTPDTYTIDTTVTNGSITPDESGIAAGADRTITYSPDTNYHLVSVTVDGASKDIGTYSGSYSFSNISANHTVVVVYAANTTPEDTYTIDTTVVNGNITPDVSGITPGSDKTITYSTGSGYHLVSVTVDGASKDIGTYSGSYSFSNINANHTIVVVYAANTTPEDTYTIHTTVVGGNITPDQSGITAGTDKTISYSPKPGNYLVSITVDGVGKDITTYPDSYSFTNINENHTIVVVYGGNVVTDTDNSLLIIIGGILLLIGAAFVATAAIRRKVKE